MRDYPHVLSRLINTPLLAHPAKAQIIADVVLRRSGVEINLSAADPTLGPLQEETLVRWQNMGCEMGERPYLFDARTGTAVIEVTGSLAHRQMQIGESSGVMGYDWIGAQFGAAESDADVKRMIFDTHSCGGEVSGCFQLADRIAATGKPTIGLANELAFSAAYAIVGACDQVILASDTAQVGSVGAIAIHVSYAGELKIAGVKPTIIVSGSHKADGNPFQDLPDDVRAAIQARIDFIGDLFVTRMAAWRGLSETAVRDTQAACFMGREALGIGFADAIASPEQIFAALAA